MLSLINIPFGEIDDKGYLQTIYGFGHNNPIHNFRMVPTPTISFAF